MHPSRAAILEFLTLKDFGTNKSLRQHLGKSIPKSGGNSPSVITHHVGLLEEADLVRHSDDDPRIIIVTSNGRRVVRALRQMVSESAAIEVWERSL